MYLKRISVLLFLLSFSVLVNAQLTITMGATTHVGVIDASTGVINFTVTGATTTSTAALLGTTATNIVGITNGVSQSFSGLASGLYSIRVTDNGGAGDVIIETDIVVTQPIRMINSYITSSICIGINSGKIRMMLDTRPVANYPRLLDMYSTTRAGLSLRKLRDSYTENAILVRRDFNNNGVNDVGEGSQDIGFRADGTLDRAALLNFVTDNGRQPNSSGFVQIWYDQSGSTDYRALNNSLTNQPRIVSFGALDVDIEDNLRLVFDGNDALSFFPVSENNFLTYPNLTSFILKAPVLASLGDANRAQFVDFRDTDNRPVYIYPSGTGNTSGETWGFAFNSTDYVVSPPTGTARRMTTTYFAWNANERFLETFKALTGGLSVFKNGTNIIFDYDPTSTGLNWAPNTMGTTPTPTNLEFTLKNTHGISALEMILYNTDETANQQAIESNILFHHNENYTYTWTGPNGFTATTKDINRLAPGSYSLSVNDGHGNTEVFGPYVIVADRMPMRHGKCFINGFQQPMEFGRN